MDDRVMVLGGTVVWAVMGAALGNITGDIALVTIVFAALGAGVSSDYIRRNDDSA